MAVKNKTKMILLEYVDNGVYLLNDDTDEEVYANFKDLRKMLRSNKYDVEGVKINSEGTLFYSSGEIMDYQTT